MAEKKTPGKLSGNKHAAEEPASIPAPKRSEKLIVYFDGGARGNGTQNAIAGAGFHITNEAGKRRGCGWYFMGKATNNEAEYTALKKGLEMALEIGAKHVVVRGDSELVVKQMKGEYQVKKDTLKPLYSSCKELQGRFDSFSIEHIYRKDNSEADSLANQAIDTKTSLERIH